MMTNQKSCNLPNNYHQSIPMDAQLKRVNLSLCFSLFSYVRSHG